MSVAVQSIDVLALSAALRRYRKMVVNVSDEGRARDQMDVCYVFV